MLTREESESRKSAAEGVSSTPPTCSASPRAQSPRALPSYATAACPPPSNGMTSPDKSLSCETVSLTRTSSKMSEADSTSEGKDCNPFYDDFCREISSLLLSHIEIDSAGSDSTCYSSCLNQMVEKSWFSTKQMFLPNKNSQKICSQFSMCFPAASTDSDATSVKSRKIRVYPTTEQKNLFRQWMGVSRKFYNLAADYLNRDDKDTVNWMAIAKMLTHEHVEDYIKSVPYQIKKIAVRDACQSFYNGTRKAKSGGGGFKMRFRSRKDAKQSVFIPKSAISQEGIYRTLSGNLKMKERSLLNNDFADSRLLLENGRWYLCVPMRLHTAFHTSENQGGGDVVAIDPGVRSFATYFSANGHFGHIGDGAFQRILNLHFKIDKLLARIRDEKDKSKKASLRREVRRARARIVDLVDELHNKAVRYFVENYNIIFLPTFNVSEMVRRGTKEKPRKMRKSTVRAMQSMRFYEFGRKMEAACAARGIRCIRCNEAYTSKTNSFTGEIMPNLGGRDRFRYDGVIVNRDINGARNILLRAMRDGSATGCDSPSMTCNKATSW